MALMLDMLSKQSSTSFLVLPDGAPYSLGVFGAAKLYGETGAIILPCLGDFEDAPCSLGELGARWTGRSEGGVTGGIILCGS